MANTMTCEEFEDAYEEFQETLEPGRATPFELAEQERKRLEYFEQLEQAERHNPSILH